MADPLNKFDVQAFMARIRRSAAVRGKTMKDVAAATGVSETTLSRMNSGQRMCDAASLAALSAWAGINPARFSRSRRDREAENRVRDTRLGVSNG